ncbi:ABC transporter permease [Actinoallomurus rhizosphaericola]|uniref:ABC transporter permease n=1 Tax=Actinoallomurus rhizosphaericola TaxID=2952536 RepID=UPI002091E46A|nr:ABC transporter permease [Actinoallomurus rhizosphaericola]MCO5993678.1 ABC transporter permease [Actinoallomurus rhizosphaericola]
MSSFQSLARAMFLGFRRDRGALFFTIALPLLFLLIIGGIFARQSTPKSKVLEIGAVPIVDQMPAEMRAGIDKSLKFTRLSDRDAALEKVRKGDYAAAIEQSGDRVVLHYSAADQVKTGTVQGQLDGLVQAANQAASGRPPKYRLEGQQVEDRSLKPIQYITPGLLGWALASAGMFGASTTLVTWRTKGLLRRLRLSPVPIRSVFAARVAVSLGVALVQTALFIGVATMPFFGLKLAHYWWMAIPMVLCGVLAFLAIGMLIGAWAKTQEAAQGVTQIVVLPMAFLGGSFFNIDDAPRWLRIISEIFPLRHLNSGMLKVLVRGEGPASVLPQMGVLLGFALVATLIAVRVFRWEQI